MASLRQRTRLRTNPLPDEPAAATHGTRLWFALEDSGIKYRLASKYRDLELHPTRKADA